MSRFAPAAVLIAALGSLAACDSPPKGQSATPEDQRSGQVVITSDPEVQIVIVSPLVHRHYVGIPGQPPRGGGR